MAVRLGYSLSSLIISVICMERSSVGLLSHRYGDGPRALMTSEKAKLLIDELDNEHESRKKSPKTELSMGSEDRLNLLG